MLIFNKLKFLISPSTFNFDRFDSIEIIGFLPECQIDISISPFAKQLQKIEIYIKM